MFSSPPPPPSTSRVPPNSQSRLSRTFYLWVNLLLISTISGNSFIPAVNAERNRKVYQCTPEECVKTSSIIQLGLEITTPRTTLNLLPGTYTSNSPVAEYLPSPNTSESIYGTPTNDLGFKVLTGSEVWFSSSDRVGNSTVDAGWSWPIIVKGPSTPVLFSRDEFRQPIDLDLGFSLNQSTTLSTSSSGGPGDSGKNGWQSIYLPPGVYLHYPPDFSPSGSSSAMGYKNVIFRSSVPLRKALGSNLGGFDLSVGVGNASGGVFGSDACDPPCGPGGMCLPSASSSSNSSSRSSSAFTCLCRPGYTGPTCLQCLPGHFGPGCQACSKQCFAGGQGGGRCDDGMEGTGGCLGSLGNSTEACNCLHGTCTSDQTCDCSAGWADGVTGKCSICAPGFDLDQNGDCRACPLGTLTCGSGKALTCSSGWAVDAATNRCIVTGGQAGCSSGQYWDGSGCSRCSPACTSCTGSGADQCLECASPRFNLNGTCVGYDAANGICDASTTGLKGVYVADNSKGRCEACPTGCLACAIPSFSITSIWNDTKCTACQEGWVLQVDQCVRECKAGFFFPEGAPNINGTCQACDTRKCSTCHITATQCSSCANPEEFATSTGECVSTCPTGTIPDNKLGRCVSCPADCATCSADGQCLTCSSIAPVLSRGRCSGVCPISTYWEDSLSSCAPCAGNCTSCTGRRDDQCVSCADGTIMKSGTCSPVSCTFISGLGMCLRSDSSKETLWWPYLLVVLLLLAIGLSAFWWIRRSRRLRKENTAAFAATLDDNEVQRRVAGIGGIFRLLNTMRANEKSPARESFFVSPASDGPPPAYTSKSNQPVFSITPPSPTAQGPARAAFVKEGHDDDQLEAFEGKRGLSRQVSFMQGYSKRDSWAKNAKPSKEFVEDDGKRNEHCMV